MYYQGGNSGIQPDGLQTLYLMNPNYVGYSDTTQHQPGLNMLFFNSNATSTAHDPNTAAQMPHAPPPLPPVASLHELQTSHGAIPRFHYKLWSSNELPENDNRSHMASPVETATSDGGAVVVPTQKGLSLSLSSQQTGFRSLGTDHDISQAGLMSNKLGSSSSLSNGVNDVQNGIMGSKYIKAVQQLLDEVVNVGKIVDTGNLEGSKEKGKKVKQSTSVNLVDGSSDGRGESSAGAELTTAQRQEVQMKKAKLVTMLDEVEQRYRQYHHQMQIVVASFEQAAGPGSAKSYTHLALKTISKQFRCLKDVISGQIKAINKSLGEEDSLVERLGGSRLKYIDNQLRQQQALQQLGMVQNNPWRPQRGLPERAVSVLRAWLFEHFLHPYPKDSDKQMLAKQTGLTRGQVSNWFINARVRLWKPMVEEMYLEEVKSQEQNSSEQNVEHEKTTPEKEFSSSKPNAAQEINGASQIDYMNNALQYSKPDKRLNHVDHSPRQASTSTLTTSPNAGSSYQPGASFVQLMKNTQKKPRTDSQNSPSSILSMEMEKNTGPKENYLTMMANANNGTGFSTFDIGQLGRFNAEPLGTGFHGNNVSLTLGLPPSENSGLQGSQENIFSNPNNELGTRIREGTKENEYNLQAVPLSSIGYGIVDFQNRKPFASQLLSDFVA